MLSDVYDILTHRLNIDLQDFHRDALLNDIEGFSSKPYF